MKFVRTYGVRSSEMNPDYSLKEYFLGMYYQECFAEFCAERGVAAYDVARAGLTWLTSASRVDFTSPLMPLWRQRVRMEVWLSRTTGVKMFSDWRAYSEDTEIARGRSVQLVADLKTHRPVRAASVAERLGTDPDSVFDETAVGHFAIPSDAQNSPQTSAGSTVQKVRFDDLDFNLHLNNVRYIPRALESVDIAYRHTHRLASYEVKYERETKFGDSVASSCLQTADTFYHTLARESDNAVLCRVKTSWLPR